MHTPLSHLVGDLDLPNPSTPVPFERFAHLKNSDDMLHRAAFWAFYAAWIQDYLSDHHDLQNGAALGVEARNDAHQLHAITQQLALRDCVLITQHDLSLLEGKHHHRNQTLLIGFICSWVLSVLLALWIGSVLW